MPGYIYNPSESIAKSGQVAQESVANIFTHLIEQKKRDNQLAQQTFESIEALKKDVNVFNEKIVSDKTKELLSKAPGLIFKNGKIDYDGLGAVRQAVSDIKDAKQFATMGGTVVTDYLAQGAKNAANMDSFENYQKEALALLDGAGPKNISDLRAKLSAVYNKNLNLDKIGGEAFLAANPRNEEEVNYTDKNGAIRKYKIEAPAGMVFNENTHNVEMPAPKTVVGPDGVSRQLTYAQEKAAELKSKMPSFFDDYRAKYNLPITKDDVIMENIINKAKGGKQDLIQRTGEQVATDKATQKITEAKAEVAPEMAKLGVKEAKADINYKLASTAKALADAKGDETKLPAGLKVTTRQIPLKDKTGKVIPGKFQTVMEAGLEKEVTMSFPHATDPNIKDKAIKIVSMGTAPNGDVIVTGYPVKGAKLNPFDEYEGGVTENKKVIIKLGKPGDLGYDAFQNKLSSPTNKGRASENATLTNMASGIMGADSFFR